MPCWQIHFKDHSYESQKGSVIKGVSHKRGQSQKGSVIKGVSHKRGQSQKGSVIKGVSHKRGLNRRNFTTRVPHKCKTLQVIEVQSLFSSVCIKVHDGIHYIMYIYPLIRWWSLGQAVRYLHVFTIIVTSNYWLYTVYLQWTQKSCFERHNYSNINCLCVRLKWLQIVTKYDVYTEISIYILINWFVVKSARTKYHKSVGARGQFLL